MSQEPLVSLCIRVNTREKGTIETLLEKIDICEVLDAIGAHIIQYLSSPTEQNSTYNSAGSVP